MISPYSRPLRPMHERSLHELARMVVLPTKYPPPAEVREAQLEAERERRRAERLNPRAPLRNEPNER